MGKFGFHTDPITNVPEIIFEILESPYEVNQQISVGVREPPGLWNEQDFFVDQHRVFLNIHPVEPRLERHVGIHGSVLFGPLPVRILRHSPVPGIAHESERKFSIPHVDSDFLYLLEGGFVLIYAAQRRLDAAPACLVDVDEDVILEVPLTEPPVRIRSPEEDRSKSREFSKVNFHWSVSGTVLKRYRYKVLVTTGFRRNLAFVETIVRPECLRRRLRRKEYVTVFAADAASLLVVSQAIWILPITSALHFVIVSWPIA